MRSLIGNMLPPPVMACPAPDSSSADPQPLRQHVGKARRAKLRGHTIGRQPGDDRVIHGGLAPRHARAAFRHVQQRNHVHARKAGIFAVDVDSE